MHDKIMLPLRLQLVLNRCRSIIDFWRESRETRLMQRQDGLSPTLQVRSLTNSNPLLQLGQAFEGSFRHE